MQIVETSLGLETHFNSQLDFPFTMALVEYGSDSGGDQEEIQPEPQPKVAAGATPLQVRKARPTPGSPLNLKPDGTSKKLPLCHSRR